MLTSRGIGEKRLCHAGFILFLSFLFSSLIYAKEGKFYEAAVLSSSETPQIIVLGEDQNTRQGLEQTNRRSLRANPNWPPKHLPAGLVNQSMEEANYLKLHKCKDAGEVYAAAYLITREHLIYQETGYNLTWVNCEMGSFIMMNQRADPNKNLNGSLTQTLDVLDFSVIHLSWYERLQRRWGKSVDITLSKRGGAGKSKNAKNAPITKGKPNKVAGTDNDGIEPVLKTTNRLKERALKMRDPNIPLAVPELNRTVAIMPFLAADNGAGHSKLGNRLHYLHACFWSIYAEMPYIVAAVKNEKDALFARNQSGLPFWDVMLIENLPKSASLPVATVQQAKARLMDGRWDFDYIYYTESDQILMMRIHEDIYAHLKMYPRRLVVPHRLSPYPEPILSVFHERNISNNSPMSWLDMSCCLPRTNCLDRKSWIHVRDDRVNIINIFGLQVPLGNINFHEEKLRSCTLNEYSANVTCP